jgi:hypothetical protein
MTSCRTALCALLAAGVACRAGPPDPIPPPESLEIVSAAPGALGALAAGTDAAPPQAQPASPFGEEGEEEVAPGEGLMPAPPQMVPDPDAGLPPTGGGEVPL